MYLRNRERKRNALTSLYDMLFIISFFILTYSFRYSFCFICFYSPARLLRNFNIRITLLDQNYDIYSYLLSIGLAGDAALAPTNGSEPTFDLRTRRHMWVEFVVISHPCSEGFFSFLPPQILTFLNSNSTRNFLRATLINLSLVLFF